MEKLDVRGMSCPEPVLMTQNILSKNPNEVEILADSKVTVENIMRFANKKGYKGEFQESGSEFTINLKNNGK